MSSDFDTLRRIVDHGIEFDYEMVGKDVVLKDFKEFFEGEGFDVILDESEVLISKKEVPVAAIMFSNRGISFEFMTINRSFQIIMLTTHLMRKYTSFKRMISDVQDMGISVIPQNTTFD